MPPFDLGAAVLLCAPSSVLLAATCQPRIPVVEMVASLGCGGATGPATPGGGLFLGPRQGVVSKGGHLDGRNPPRRAQSVGMAALAPEPRRARLGQGPMTRGTQPAGACKKSPAVVLTPGLPPPYQLARLDGADTTNEQAPATSSAKWYGEKSPSREGDNASASGQARLLPWACRRSGRRQKIGVDIEKSRAYNPASQAGRAIKSPAEEV